MTAVRSLMARALVTAFAVSAAAPLAASDDDTPPTPKTATVPASSTQLAALQPVRAPATPTPTRANEPVLAPGAAVSIAKPIGTVSIAREGDKLGRARRGTRTTKNGVVTIDFSPQRRSGGRRYNGIALPAGMPLDRARLTSSFGNRYHPISGQYRRHSGIDLAAPRGTPVKATSDGVVIASGWMGGYGIAVRLDHGGGTETRYAHMSRALVSPDQDVKRGQVIGYVGSTGRSTGPHLHYEIRKSGRAVNPMP